MRDCDKVLLGGWIESVDGFDCSRPVRVEEWCSRFR